MKLSQHIDKVIIDYLDHNLSAKNRLAFEQMLDESEQLKAYFDDFKSIWVNDSLESEDYDSITAHEAFEKRITKEETYKRRTITQWLRVAAVVIFFITSGIGFYHLGMDVAQDRYMTEIACLDGENAAIMLPDSSRVWINANSTLRYKGQLNKAKRHIYLEGEAYFEVKSDKKHPFIVHARNVQVEATGTRFNVSAYQNDKLVKTALLEGQVAIKTPNNHYQMTPNQLVSVNVKNEKIWHRKINDIEDAIAWREGRLVIKNERMAGVVPQLIRFFDIAIEMDQELAGLRFSGTFQDQSLDDLQHILELTLGIKVEREGNHFILKKNN